MAGIASEFIDYSKTNNNRPVNFELFSVRLFGNINADCVLNDITQYGCSIYIPKGINTPTDIFSLLIMSPDDDKKLHTVIAAQTRWIDKQKSAIHDIAGIKFLDVDSDTSEKISMLIQHVIEDAQSRVKCCLLKK